MSREYIKCLMILVSLIASFGLWANLPSLEYDQIWNLLYFMIISNGIWVVNHSYYLALHSSYSSHGFTIAQSSLGLFCARSLFVLLVRHWQVCVFGLRNLHTVCLWLSWLRSSWIWCSENSPHVRFYQLMLLHSTAVGFMNLLTFFLRVYKGGLVRFIWNTFFNIVGV